MDNIRSLVQMFLPVFTSPSFDNFVFLILAWIQTSGRACMSNLLRAARFMPDLVPRSGGRVKHFSALYRFFTRAKWELDPVGERLVSLLARRLDERELMVVIDDTLQTRGGPKILGAGMHFDGRASTYGGSEGSHKVFSFGLNFVTLAVWIPVGFIQSGGIAVPVLFRLYRSKKTCPEGEYRKRTELAVDMLQVFRRWFPRRNILLVVDHEYSCKTLLYEFDEWMDMVGRLPWNAALYDPEFEQKKMGRPRVWGPKLQSPQQLRDDDRIPWRPCVVRIYGRRVELLVKTMQAQWKSAPPDRRLTVVVTRDPTGRFDDACFFRLQPNAGPTDVLVPFSHRWSLEQCYRDCKQLLRIETVQNGWARGTTRADTNQPGPSAPKGRDPTASRRTVPFGILCYGFVVAWYLLNGSAGEDILRARNEAPWYLHKRTISFGDMLKAFRRQMVTEQLWQTPSERGFAKRKPPPGPDLYEGAA